MLFGDKIKELRKVLGLSQSKLAEMTGVTLRSIQNYESNKRYPKDILILNKLALALGTTPNKLMPEEECSILTSLEISALKSKYEISQLVNQLSSLFWDEKLSEEDKDNAVRSIMTAYLDSKNLSKT